MSTETTWTPIPGFGGWYDLSADGQRVRSWRKVGNFGVGHRAETPIELVAQFNEGSATPTFVLRSWDDEKGRSTPRRLSINTIQKMCEASREGDQRTTWTPIPGYRGRYEVSSCGRRVRSWAIHGHASLQDTPADEPRELKMRTVTRKHRRPYEGFGLMRDGVERFVTLQTIHRLLEEGELDDGARWYPLPAPFEGLYEIDEGGRVRSLYRAKGGKERGRGLVLRERPRILKGRMKGGKRTNQYQLVVEGRAHITTACVIARSFPIGHPVRRGVLGEDDNGKRQPMPSQTKSRGKRTSPASPPARVVEEIRRTWARRNLRRYHTVTVEILADLHLLTRRQVEAIIRGVEEVRA